MPLIIFDDDRHDLTPMTDLRPVFDVRCGVYTMRERLRRQWRKQEDATFVPLRLLDLHRASDDRPVNDLPPGAICTLVNGAWLLADAKRVPPEKSAIIDAETGCVLAATLPRADAAAFLETGDLPENTSVETITDQVVLSCAWHVRTYLERTLQVDMTLARILDAYVPDQRDAIMGEHPVEIHNTARVGRNVVFDVEHGPVIVDRHAVLRPGAILCGPCYVGERSVVVDRAHIKANTVIGPVCKVGGEVGATIFQGFANKGHEGHLGDSWVGEWANFGAGTTNSNLLNTYGEITMRPTQHGPRRRTGLTFLGAIVGDHVKFAINTRIMTGAVVGTGAMIATAAPAPTTVPAFAWMTDDGTRPYRIEKFLEVATIVMARRNVALTPAYASTLTALHTRSASEVGN